MRQHSQRQLIEYLFGVFMHECTKAKSLLLPAYYRERIGTLKDEDVKGRKRAVADLIAGMTESQAIAVYQRLNGITNSSALEKILV
jgi:dGTP triphosphohydrolase